MVMLMEKKSEYLHLQPAYALKYSFLPAGMMFLSINMKYGLSGSNPKLLLKSEEDIHGLASRFITIE